MKDPKESCAGKVANCSERSLQFRSPEVGVAVEIMRDQMIDRFGLFRGPLFHSRHFFFNLALKSLIVDTERDRELQILNMEDYTKLT